MLRKITVFCLFVLINYLVLNTAATAVPSQNIQWQEYSDKVFQEAKKSHKHVLLYGKADWCHWCQKLNATTWTDPAVILLVQAHYIPVRVDIDRESDIADRYQINITPTIIILDDNAQVVQTHTGYAVPQDVINFLSESPSKSS